MQLMTRILLPLALAVAFAGPATAQALFLDDFEYPAGDLLTDHGWTLIRSGTDIVVSSGGLSHSVYPHSGAGNAADLVRDGLQEVKRTFGVQTAGALYAAFLVRPDTASETFNEGIFFYLGPTGTDIFNRFATVYVNEDGNGMARFGVSKSSGIQFTGYDYPLGQTHLIVVKYEFLPGDPDPLSLWVNPDLELPEPPAGDVSTTNTTDALELAEVVLSQINGGPTATIDGIYIGTAWPRALHVFSDGFESGDTSAWPDRIKG